MIRRLIAFHDYAVHARDCPWNASPCTCQPEVGVVMSDVTAYGDSFASWLEMAKARAHVQAMRKMLLSGLL